jgi:hypothetical protein
VSDTVHNARRFAHISGMGDELLLGPYQCWGIVEVYRIPADGATLDAYVKRIIGDLSMGSGVNIRLAENDHSVYLVHYQFDTLISRSDKGVFDDNSLQFHIPVLVTLAGVHAEKYVAASYGKATLDENEQITFEASVPVFSYGAHMINVITSNELRGQDMAHAEILSSILLCLDDLDAATGPRKMLDVGVLMGPPKTRDAGTTLTRQSMVQLWSRRPIDKLKDDSDRKDDRRNVTQSEPLAHILDLITLKQFPNDRDPMRACYQSLVHVTRRAYEQNRDGKTPKKPIVTKEKDYVETVWDLEGRIGPADPRLESCSLLINAEHPEADILRSLGFSSVSELRVRGIDGLETLFFVVKPNAYIKMSSDIHDPSTCFEEAQGESFCYRTDTVGPKNGWCEC